MTWNSHHKRGEILRTVIAVADERRDGILPMNVDGVTQTFDGELDLLAALQLKWHTCLSGRIEQELNNQPLDLEAAVIRAWHHTADALPGVRLILDRYREQPLDATMATVMAKATRKEHILLAVMAGRSGYDELAVPVGARIEERARATYRPLPTGASTGGGSLLDRIRAALAA